MRRVDPRRPAWPAPDRRVRPKARFRRVTVARSSASSGAPDETSTRSMSPNCEVPPVRTPLGHPCRASRRGSPEMYREVELRPTGSRLPGVARARGRRARAGAGSGQLRRDRVPICELPPMTRMLSIRPTPSRIRPRPVRSVAGGATGPSDTSVRVEARTHFAPGVESGYIVATRSGRSRLSLTRYTSPTGGGYNVVDASRSLPGLVARREIEGQRQARAGNDNGAGFRHRTA